jgi:hemerythrin
LPLIEWTQKLSVSIEEIDKQHKQLVNLINLLYDSMKVGKGRDVLGKVLNELADYTVYHFDTEEKMLMEYMYPSYTMHKREHDNLTKQVTDIKTKFDLGDAVLTVELMIFLKDWLNNHILQADKKYSDFLNSKGVH